MKKQVICAAICAWMAMMPQGVWAQDVLVTEDGDAIKAWQVDMGGSKIYYRAGEAEDAPLKSIDKKQVLMWKKADGTRVVMGQEEQKPAAAPAAAAPAPEPVKASAFTANPNLEADNLKLVRDFNAPDLFYLEDDFKKDAGMLAWVLGIKEGSIIETPELKATFSVKATTEKSINDFSQANVMYLYINEALVITLKNKTNKTLYIDQANSFFIYGEDAIPYYTPSVTTSSASNTSGGSVNLGAFGFGGLLRGINVGGASTNSSTTTTYAQRVISIPPMASVSLAPMPIEKYGKMSHYTSSQYAGALEFLGALVKVKKTSTEVAFKGMKRGEKVDLTPDIASPFSIHVTYAADEGLTETQSMRMGFYCRQLVGIDRCTYTDDLVKQFDTRQTPLYFFTFNPFTFNNQETGGANLGGAMSGLILKGAKNR